MDTKNGLGFNFYVDKQQFEKDLEAVNKKIEGVADRTTLSSEKMAAAMDKVGKLMLAHFTLSGVEEFGAKMLEIHGDFQDLETGFRTIIGDAERAKNLMNQLIETAAITPFNFTDVMEGGKQLLGYGFEVEKVNNELLKLGNISAGLKIPLGDLVYLYGTLKTSGRVMTLDLTQFAGRGIPIYKELAKVLNIAESEVREYASSSKIAFSDVEKAFENMTKEGGIFGGLMEKTAKNWNTKISNISDSLMKMFNEIGERNEEIVTDAIDVLAFLVDKWEDVLNIIKEAILIYGAYKAAAMAVVAVQRLSNIVMAQAKVEIQLAAMAGQQLSLSQAKVAARAKLLQINMQKLTTSLNTLKAAFVSSVPTAALTAVVYGLYKVVDGVREAEERSEELRMIWTEYKTGVENINHNKEIQQLETVKKLISDVKTSDSQRKELIKELQTEHNILKSYTEKELESNQLITGEIEKQISLIKQKAVAEYYANKLVETKDKINQISQEYRDKYGSKEFEFQRKHTREWLDKGEYLSGYKAQKTLHTIANIISVGRAEGEEHVEYLKIAKEIYQLDRVVEDAEKNIEESKRNQLQYEHAIAKSEKNSSSYVREKQKAQEELLASHAELEKLKRKKDDTPEFSKKFRDAVSRYEEAKKKAKDFEIKNPFETSGNGKNNEERKKEELEKKKIENARASRDLVLAAKKIEVEASKDSIEKKLTLLELEGMRELNSIKDNHEDKLREYEKYGEDKRILIEEENILYQKAIANQNTIIANAKKALLKEERDRIETEFSLYEEELEKIEKKHNTDLSLTDNTERKRVIENEKKKAIEELENHYLEKEKWFRGWIDSLMDLSISELKKQIVLAEEALKDSSLNREKQGVLKAQLRIMREELNVAIRENEKTGDIKYSEKYKEWDVKARKLREYVSALNDTVDSFEDLDEASKNALKFVTNTSIGIIGIIDGIKKYSEISEEVLNKVAFAEKASIILTVVSTLFKIFQEFEKISSINYNIENEQYEQETKLLRQKIKLQEKLNNLLEEERKLRFDTILGEDKISKAVEDYDNIYRNEERFQKRVNGLLKEYKKEREKLEEAPKPKMAFTIFSISSKKKPVTLGDYGSELKTLLAQMKAKTGTTHIERTGLLGLKKTVVEDYDSILKLYPDLIDEQGKLNLAKAKELVTSGLLAEKDKERFEELIAIQEQQEKNLKAVKEHLKSTFGELGGILSDSIVEAWETGEDAMNIFERKATGVFKNIGKMILEQLIVRRWSEPMLEELMAVYEDKRFESLSEEERAQKIIEEQARIAKKYGESMKNGSKGLQEVFDSFMKSLGQTQDNLKGVFEGSKGIASSLTHEDATMLEARSTAILQSNIERFGALLRIEKELSSVSSEARKIYNQVEQMKALGESIAYYLHASAGHIANIDRNTSVLPEVRDELRKIRTRLV